MLNGVGKRYQKQMDKQTLKKSYQEGLIDEDTFKNELFKLETIEKPPRKPKRIYEDVHEEDFKKLLLSTKKPEHKIAFLLAFGSGLRISEIAGGQREDGTIMAKLLPENIHLNEHKIFVKQAKGMKDRITYAPRELRQKDLKYFPIKIGKRAVQAAFLRNSLKAGINWEVGKYIRNGKEIPIYRYHFHCLRSSFVTRLLNKGIPPHQVQLLVGHSNLSTTSGYAKANPDTAIENIFRMGL